MLIIPMKRLLIRIKMRITKDDQKVLYSNLKKELKMQKDFRYRNIFLKLITEENDLDELMDYVCNNPRSIEDYADTLKNKYYNETISAKTEKHIGEYVFTCKIPRNSG